MYQYEKKHFEINNSYEFKTELDQKMILEENNIIIQEIIIDAKQ